MASDDVAVLSQPTVADLVAELQKLDQSKPVRIEDADTNWCIDVIHTACYTCRTQRGAV